MLAYRKEIDGLRCIAVLAVIFFHGGFLPSGYLGVDIFFVISGYLITSLLEPQAVNQGYSLATFYERRIRRIVPLTILIAAVAFLPGYYLLLPDSYENLAQSAIATCLFANNILLYITSGYWDVVNDYKPLMHTWSLGVEVQFYLLFPFILLLLGKLPGKRSRLYGVVALAVLSLLSNFIIHNRTFNFFSVSSRFYEFAFGAIAFYIGQVVTQRGPWIPLLTLTGIVVTFFFPLQGNSIIANVVVAAFTAVLLCTYHGGFAGIVLEHRLITFIGQISFSMYMWHQVVFAFARITLFEHIGPWQFALLLLLIVLLSVATYYFVEVPFRKRSFIRPKPLLMFTALSILLLVSGAYYIYARAGVVRDVPELDIYTGRKYRPGANSGYNQSVYSMGRPFNPTIKKKILVVGNSFARDVVNMLRENQYTDSVEIRYARYIKTTAATMLISKADLVIFGSPISRRDYIQFCASHGLDTNKVLVFGSKNFGISNDYFFNTTVFPSRCALRTLPLSSIAKQNKTLKDSLRGHYVDILSLLSDGTGTVPVFTPTCKLISQDCRHLTPAGAKYIGALLVSDTVFSKFISQPPLHPGARQ